MKLNEYISEEWKQSYDHYGRPEWSNDWEENDYRDMDNPLPKNVKSSQYATMWDQYGDDTFEYGDGVGLSPKYISTAILPIADIVSSEPYLDPMHMNALKQHGIKSKHPIIVVKYHGEYLCIDGNHRLAYMHMRGIDTAKVELYDYDRMLKDIL
jgi:hypothetical protein